MHCLAGCGRTMTLVGLWALRQGMPARAYLGWARLCRDASSLHGPQQQYLLDAEAGVEREYATFRCAFGCTYRGSHENVERHEQTCKLNPAYRAPARSKGLRV